MRGPKTLTALLAVLLLAAPAAGAVAAEDEEAEATARRKAMLKAGRKALCRVHFYFKRPEDEAPEAMGGFRAVQQMTKFQYQQFVDAQKSLVVAGALLDGDGHVLVADTHFDGRYIDRIEVVGPDGTRYPAEREKLLGRAPGVLLKIAKPPENWRPPTFGVQEKITEPGAAYIVSLNQSGKDWWLTLDSLGASYQYGGTGHVPDRLKLPRGSGLMDAMFPGGGYNPYAAWLATAMSEMIGGSRQPALLCNDEGKPIGAAMLGWPLETGQGTVDWQRERLLEGPGISFAELERLTEVCREEFGKKVHKCKILYRREAADQGMPDIMAMMRGAKGGRGGPQEKEWETFGLAVGPRRLLIPQTISRQEAAKIDTIEVTIDGETHAAELAGAFKELGAFLVDLKEATFPASTEVTAGEVPERMRLFFTVRAKKKMGEKHLRVRPNRWFTRTRGYKNRYTISPVFSASPGSWILDRDLKVLGLYTRQRREGEEISAMSPQQMGRMMMREMSGNARIFWAESLEERLADPVAFYDHRIRFKTREEAKRIVWLGVEFTPMGPELAKQLGVEGPTKDGTIGLYVNRVYEASPAEKMGIGSGDILLEVETPKRPRPIELSAMGSGGAFGSFDWTQYMDYKYVEEYGGTRPKWPSRLNYLTTLLQSIGEGEEVKLTYLQDGEKVSKDYAIQTAPRDFASAEKYKNKEAGLTVKDLTYEVRTALRLDEDKKAVVVSKVEPGSPAEVAKVRPFELLTAVDGRPVTSAKEFGKRIEKALKSDEEAVRLTVEYLGKSRLADLDLAQVEAWEPPTAPEESEEESEGE